MNLCWLIYAEIFYCGDENNAQDSVFLAIQSFAAIGLQKLTSWGSFEVLILF